MAYDGFYSGLSERASVSEILNQAIVVQTNVEALALAAEDSATTATTAATNAATSATTATADAVQTAADRAAVEAYVTQSQRQFSIYGYQKDAPLDSTVLRITPQYQLVYVTDSDWVIEAAGTGVLTATIHNAGNLLQTLATFTVTDGVVVRNILPHTIFNGDSVRFIVTSGNLTDVAFTLRYKSDAV